jgi:hypothetical protein
MDRKSWILSKLADKASKITEVAKAFSERKAGYGEKITAIKERLLENYKFWSSKTTEGAKARLADIDKDTNFIKTVQHRPTKLTEVEKERIDLIMKKHSVHL